MRLLLDKLTRSPLIAGLLDERNASREIHVRSLAGSLRSLVPSLLYQRTAEPFLIVFEDRADADEAYADLVTVLGDEHTLLYQEEHHTAATLRDSIDAEVISWT